MMPALLSFYPARAANILRYRYNSLDESRKIARVFGYDGAMFAWTAYVVDRSVDGDTIDGFFFFFFSERISVDHK